MLTNCYMEKSRPHLREDNQRSTRSVIVSGLRSERTHDSKFGWYWWSPPLPADFVKDHRCPSGSTWDRAVAAPGSS